MAKVHYVKKSRKAYRKHGIKKGEPYYYWRTLTKGKQYVSVKHFSKTKPKPSQLTRSEFLKAVYLVQEDIDEAYAEGISELRDLQQEWASSLQEIIDSEEEKLGNMPEALQESPTAELIRERIDAITNYTEAIEGVSIEPSNGQSFGEPGELEDHVSNVLNEFRDITLEV